MAQKSTKKSTRSSASGRTRSARSTSGRSASGRSKSASAGRRSSSRSAGKSSARGTSSRSSGRTRTSSHPLIDHDEIRQWAEERGAHPACVKGTGKKGDVGVLRIDFPGYSGETSLQEIGWDEWFERFDERGLALMVQETTSGGQKSNFNKLVSRDTVASGRSTSARSKSASVSNRSSSRSAGKSSARSTSSRSGGRTRTSSHPLIDHDEIRQWAEERGANPACVKGTGKKGDVGMIRLDFPGYSGETSLQEIGWDEWFERFDERGLALMVQDTTSGGQKSNFNKLVSRETVEAKSKPKARAAR